MRLFFSTREYPDIDGLYKSYPAFVDLSLDGRFRVLEVAQDPILTLGQTGSFDEFGIYPFCPIKVNDEIFAVYAGWTRCMSVPFDVSLGLAKANSNASKFQRVGTGPILTKSIHEPFVISSPKIRFINGKYLLFYIAGSRWQRFNSGKFDVHYSIRMAISEDLVNWKRLNRNIIAPITGSLESQASPDVFQLGDSYIMIFCYRKVGDYRNKSRGYKLGLAYSDNLIDWVRCDNRLEIDHQDSQWDDESQNYPHVFQTTDDRLYIAYTGNGIGATGVGIAELNY